MKMDEYNKLIDKIKLENAPRLGKDNTHKEYLIKLYTLNPPLPPKLLVTCVFSDIHQKTDHVNLVLGEMVINDMHYPLAKDLVEIMKKFRARMRERTNNYKPEYIFPTQTGHQYTSNSAGMFFKKVFGMSISCYMKLYDKKELELSQKPKIGGVPKKPEEKPVKKKPLIKIKKIQQ